MTNDTKTATHLSDRYMQLANEYLAVFCEKHGFDFLDARSCWVANNVGDVCIIGDFCVSYDDIRTDIDCNAPKEEYVKYYSYSQEAAELGLKSPNYRNWLRGAPKLSPRKLKSLRKAKNDLILARARFEADVNELSESLKYVKTKKDG